MKFGIHEIDLAQIRSIEDLHDDNGYIIHFLNDSQLAIDTFTAVEIIHKWATYRFDN